MVLYVILYMYGSIIVFKMIIIIIIIVFFIIIIIVFFFFKQKTAYEIGQWLEFRRVLFRSLASTER